MMQRLVLAGLSGTGKSTLAREAAQRCGWTAIDTDAMIEQQEGTTIPELFAGRGEEAFRTIERRLFVDALRQDRVVIATGGGAVVSEEVWTPELLRSDETLVVTLDASPETILDRLSAQLTRDGAVTQRPLLASDDPLAAITAMKAARTEAYSRADITLSVEHRSVARIADDLAELVRLGSGTPSVVDLTLPGVSSRICVGPGASAALTGTIQERWPRARRVWLAVDANVYRSGRDTVDRLIAPDTFDVHLTEISSGEGSKSLSGVSRLYDWLLDDGVERDDVLVAVGGGVTGDLAGFVAATVLRGIGLVQIPTTLLAMVDSSVGGKTGINHETGKNLIGAFYQPPRVLIDPLFLQTLPPRELTSGWAEIIKHAVIEGSTPGGNAGELLDVLERNQRALMRLDEPTTSWVVRRNVSIKAAVVEADEREADLRAILNFGHTFGHGIEAAGYRYLHGEAIAVGLHGALLLGERMGTIDSDLVQRVKALIESFGLPLVAGVDPDEVRRKMARDKKKSGGAQRWILPVPGPGVTIRTDVPENEIAEVLNRIVQPA